jgi:hypothetical protein
MSEGSILQRFAPIGLTEMEAVQLQYRMDTKYVFNAGRLEELFAGLLHGYRLLEVDGRRGVDYATRYFDTAGLKHYFDHHNGRSMRSKVRVRCYGNGGPCVLEVKRKTGRGGTDKRRTPLTSLPAGLDAAQQSLRSVAQRLPRTAAGRAGQPVPPPHLGAQGTRRAAHHRHRTQLPGPRPPGGAAGPGRGRAQGGPHGPWLPLHGGHAVLGRAAGELQQVLHGHGAHPPRTETQHLQARAAPSGPGRKPATRMKFFGMNLFHEDLWEMVFKFGLDAAVVFILIRLIYYPVHRKKENLFTYFVFNFLIFFLCLLMNNVKLSMGFGFGLFAVFSIIRYRTEQLEVKDMTYLFAAICLAVINALAGKKISLAELAFTNGMILVLVYVLEQVWLTRHEAMRQLLYERIELIKPANREALYADLRERLGIHVSRVEIGRIDLLRDTVLLRVFYFEDEQDLGNFREAPRDDGDD